MKVEDTYILPDEVTFDKKDMKEQAGASFKAGRKEVVDWLKRCQGYKKGFLTLEIPGTEFRDKLREWGVE